MAKFTTRVELHNIRSITGYDELHKEMKQRGFSRLIKREGVTYHLPHAEYSYSGDQTKKRVLALAKDAVAALDASASILVTESKGSRAWDGLKIKKIK